MTQVLKNRKGVTLVELLAVIVIMGIIAAIAVPAIGKLIDNSRKNAEEATYISITEAAKLYKISTEESTFTLADLVSGGYIALDADYVKSSIDGTGLTTVAHSAVDISINSLNAVTITVTVSTGHLKVYFKSIEMAVTGTTPTLTLTGEAA